MAKKIVTRSANQDFNELRTRLNVLFKTHNFMDELDNFSKLTIRDECDGCANCQLIKEVRPDLRRPGKFIVVLVKKCMD
jgi:predicted metal-binding protein